MPWANLNLQGLSRTSDGLLICEMDLNLCRQVKDVWGMQVTKLCSMFALFKVYIIFFVWLFQMTQRLELYVESLAKAIKPDFKPQVIKRT